MKTKNQKNLEEKLREATSQLIANLILDRNASQHDVDSGVYKPISNASNLINLERAFVVQKTEPESRNKKSSTP